MPATFVLLVAVLLSPSQAMDAYMQPYVQTKNFSGAVRLERGGRVIFQRAYGLADRSRRVPNTLQTRFHIASLSMQFTAAAALRLVDSGRLSLDEDIAGVAPDVANAGNITFRQLLEERSGLPDINALPSYGAILQRHQTPASLVAAIRGLPANATPNSPYDGEEHSAYNILALTIEQRTGMAFASAMQTLLFEPLALPNSGEDDDTAAGATLALGYQPKGIYDVEAAPKIHWSAKSGNGSAYSTVGDEARWLEELFSGRALSAQSLRTMLDTTQIAGFGWFKRFSPRFQEERYYLNGRSPGFASYVLYLPKERLKVIVLSNIYSSAPTAIGGDLAAIALGKPYTAFKPLQHARQVADSTFSFGADFYRPNAQLHLVTNRGDVELIWPGGSVSALIPVGDDRFIDRSYWEDVTILRDRSGEAAALLYGSFRGARTTLKSKHV
jgi:CubicO group peptidase (beta-lactamase class C family)